MTAAFSKKMVNFLYVCVYLFEIEYLSHSGPTTDKQDQALEKHTLICVKKLHKAFKNPYM